MTLEQILALFPERSIALLRTERGEGGERKLVWMAQWDAGYFTSDTDRHVWHGSGHSEAARFGETPEEALEKLAHTELEAAKRAVAYHERELREAREIVFREASRLELKGTES
jgi:hypothetical protein